jgi:aminopeptidase N
MTEFHYGVRARVFPLLCAVALLVPDLSAARVTAGAIDVLHYDVEVKPDFDQRTITGMTTIRFRSLASTLTEVSFSPNAMTIHEARMNGTVLRIIRETDSIALELARPVRRGETAEVTLTYSGTPARGLTFEGRAVYSSYFACDWMICRQDDPGDKATLQMSLVLPKDMTSWGPGTLRSRRAVASGLERQVWREDRPYSSYLFGFAAGDVQHATEKHGQIELAFLSTSATPERLGRLFAPTSSMLQFFEQKAGVSFPQRRYVQLHVEGSAAQEAINFSVLGDDVLAPMLTMPEEDWAIAHELAILQRRADEATAAGLDVPLTYAGPYPSLRLRRAITYSKGAVFMDRLRRELGDEVFWRALQRYTRSHAGGVVESRDFQRVFEQASGRDLQALFAKWVY